MNCWCDARQAACLTFSNVQTAGLWSVSVEMVLCFSESEIKVIHEAKYETLNQQFYEGINKSILHHITPNIRTLLFSKNL